uniref:CUB domain-containing protein n=1 Tax=Trichuris muris TaxID=70415 RepID=A0A5S6Q4T7_TRIMR
MGIPYDMGSVMHYGPTAFSKDYKLFTIVTLNKGYQRTIGQREAPSFLDLALINRAYCSDKCSKLPCENGGYTHPRYCDRCLCPAGLGGPYCKENEPSKESSCGGVLKAAVFSNWTVISSPDYPKPFRKGQRCSWVIKGDPGTRLFVEFIEKFSMSCSETCEDYVEVKSGSDLRSTGMRYCCSAELPKSVIWADDNLLVIIFNAASDSGYFGFKARVQQYGESTRPFTAIGTTHEPTSMTTNLCKQIVEPAVPEWSVWSSWSTCSRECGACGLETRLRSCSGPSSLCQGESYQHRRCNAIPCIGRATCSDALFLDQPCSHNSMQICSSIDSKSRPCEFSSCCKPYEPVRGRCQLRQGFSGDTL